MGSKCSAGPLAAIRTGYLGLAGVAAVLLFVIHRRLAGGRNLAGFLALCAYSGFALLGFLPAVGNVPKQLMVLFASLAALATTGRRWILAGVAAWLSFMDWQIGALTLCAVLGAAFLDVKGRGRALVLSLVGALLGALPFVLFYAAHDALGVTWRQIGGASFARGVVSMAVPSVGQRLEHLWNIVGVGCRGHEWLFVMGVAGMLIYPFWIRRHAGRATLRLAVALAIYHYGLVVFSLLDFQGLGDLFILLHSVAFFAAVSFVEAHRTMVQVLARRRARAARGFRRRVTALHVVFLLAILGSVRPSVLRSSFSVTPRGMEASSAVTLEDQLEVSRRLEEVLKGREIVFLDAAELLLLSGRTSSLPFVYWNSATHAYYRASPDEKSYDTLARLLGRPLPEAMVLGRLARFERQLGDGYREVRLTSSSGSYSIGVFLRDW